MTLIIKKINDNKRGVFTSRPFETNDVILKFPTNNLTGEQVSKLSSEQRDNVLQVGTDRFIDLEKETPFFINHNCNPNCYVKAVVNSAFLIALRPISKDEEITFDYSLTSTDSETDWSMPCNCHRYYCRKTISGFNTLPKDKQEEFVKGGILPRYIKG